MKTVVRPIWLLLLLLAPCFCEAAEATKPLFPLEIGNYWIYKGKIKWTPEGADQKIRSKRLAWKMTVHDARDYPRGRIALVSGFPNDVAWYEEGMTPQYSLLVQDDRCVYWNDYRTERQALEAANAIEADTPSGMSNFRCIIEFPLSKGKKYDALDESRKDTMYAWYVEDIDKVRLKVKGHKNQGLEMRYRLVYRTLPDHIIMEFVPGLGLTRYLYQHHGAVAFEDLRLVEHGRKKP